MFDLQRNTALQVQQATAFNESLALFNERQNAACGLMPTIAASFVNDPKQSKVGWSVGFRSSPIAVTEKGANWLWAWSLGIPSRNEKTPMRQQKFVRWQRLKE